MFILKEIIKGNLTLNISNFRTFNFELNKKKNRNNINYIVSQYMNT